MKKNERMELFLEIYSTYYQEMGIYAGESYKKDRGCAYISAKVICLPKNVLDDPSEWNIFEFLHEIGHIKTNKVSMRVYEKEYLATQWAAEEANRIGFKVKSSWKKIYQDYIWHKREICINKGGKNVPDKEALQIKW